MANVYYDMYTLKYVCVQSISMIYVNTINETCMKYVKQYAYTPLGETFSNTFS